MVSGTLACLYLILFLFIKGQEEDEISEALIHRYLSGRKYSFQRSQGGLRKSFSFKQIYNGKPRTHQRTHLAVMQTPSGDGSFIEKYDSTVQSSDLGPALVSIQRMQYHQTLMFMGVAFLASLTSICFVVYKYRKEIRPCIEFSELAFAKVVEWVVLPIRLFYRFIVNYFVYPIKASFQNCRRWIREYYHPSLITAHHF